MTLTANAMLGPRRGLSTTPGSPPTNVPTGDQPVASSRNGPFTLNSPRWTFTVERPIGLLVPDGCPSPFRGPIRRPQAAIEQNREGKLWRWLGKILYFLPKTGAFGVRGGHSQALGTGWTFKSAAIETTPAERS
jgi:hypothetical protein